jgi:hypothetical protein
MTPEPAPETPPACEESALDGGPDGHSTSPANAVELSEFSQRLASFGLGETPDSLLTDARKSVKRRPRN